jgi:hypothetical protein
MAESDYTTIAQEKPSPVPKAGTKHGWEDYAHQHNLKKGIERLDRRSAHPNRGGAAGAKKHGHGGKFTVDGPYTDEDYADHIPAAMDENDPNFIDPEAEDQLVLEAAVPVVEVAKVEPTGVAAVHVAS